MKKKKSHIDQNYEEELTRLRKRILMMAGSVEKMIAEAMLAFVQRDTTQAKIIIEKDHQINRDEIEIDELCLIILAKRQPMASDLRFITLSLKMVTDLERIGDLAVNICERVIVLENFSLHKSYIDFSKMSTIVQSMLRDSIDAFVVGDVIKAQEVVECDDKVDELHTEIFRQLLAMMTEDESNVRQGMHIQSVAKILERMADHCTNLAEQVIFMVKGKDIRHIGKL